VSTATENAEGTESFYCFFGDFRVFRGHIQRGWIGGVAQLGA